MEAQREIRTTNDGVALEVREGQAMPTLQGYSALFDTRTTIFGLFTESLRQGAFTKTLADKADVRSLFNHEPNFVLGRTRSGTLRLREDVKGLWMENDLPDTQVARDVVEGIRRGDISGQSFGFTIKKQEWQFSEDPAVLDHREIIEADLFDVSVVTFPAYKETSVGIRSLAEAAHRLARAERDELRKVAESGGLEVRLETVPEIMPQLPTHDIETMLRRIRLARNRLAQ